VLWPAPGGRRGPHPRSRSCFSRWISAWPRGYPGVRPHSW
jgi:hypothetical protein